MRRSAETVSEATQGRGTTGQLEDLYYVRKHRRAEKAWKRLGAKTAVLYGQERYGVFGSNGSENVGVDGVCVRLSAIEQAQNQAEKSVCRKSVASPRSGTGQHSLTADSPRFENLEDLS